LKTCRTTASSGISSTSMGNLILASQSPRRRQLLEQFSIPFEVVFADIDERPLSHELPDRMTIRLARQKATAVFEQLGSGYRVLGGDTTVSVDGRILGKPADKTAAMEMLQGLSGKSHFVYSAVALADENGCNGLLSVTRVTFFNLSSRQISAYCDTEEPYDKAGAYGIQGQGGEFVSTLEGSYSGVIGLPLWETHRLLTGNA